QIYATGFLENDNEVELVARIPGMVWGLVEHLRREIRRFIDGNFSPDNGALMKALVVGDMGSISKSTRAEFTAAGVNHVLSISGLHVGMLGLVIFWLVRLGCSFSTILLLRLNLIKVATSCSFIAVLFYTGLAGGMVPTVRSAIMIGVYELAVLMDREEEVLTSLTFAALLIALYWPGVCADVSFQLSFLAVLFIVLGMRKTQEWFPLQQPQEQLPQERSWLQGRLRKVGLYLAVPVLATIGTGPLIAHYFGHLSLVGFVANPVVVPLVGFVVVPLGLLIAFVSLLQPLLAVPLIWMTEPLVSGTIRLVAFFSGLPYANIAVPVPNMVELMALYLIVVSVLLLRGKRHAVLAFATVLLAFTVDGCFWWQERFSRQDLRVTYLSVGHGDATVVEFPGSKVLLIDAGGTMTGEFDTGESIVAPYLRSRKILKVDYLLVSHPRVDHYGGMRTIVREFGPKEFWSGPSRGRTNRFEELEEELESARVRQLQLTDQEVCRAIDHVLLCVLYPSVVASGDVSVVVRLSFGKTSFLFAGDIEKRDEKALLEKPIELSSTVLKVPRHGSHTSSTDEFVAKVSPKLAIISVGERNRFGWPREEVISRYREAGSEILHTGRDGAVTVETDGKTLRYHTYRSGKTGVLSF
ncbi:MAG TPA: DNA internalization-related competence protein ComEC/Rec2, partial [Candidatus Binatia bacterium]|nr:DNA internalization-related competence protein ComEC/Rec2 [Candidatus Binatia bacterium]